MLVYYDKGISALVFKMEPTDWHDGKHERGIKCIKEIQQVVPEDYWLTESYGKREVIWYIDSAYIDEFCSLFKKLFPFEYLFKKIRIYE